MRHLLTLTALLLSIAHVTFADALPYQLDSGQSKAECTYRFEDGPGRGVLPFTAAELNLDFDTLSKSKVTATLSTKEIKSGIIFVTATLRGPKMLDTGTHPTITFTSTSITGRIPKAKVTGTLTIRGTTRPITLDAELFRPKRTSPNDLSRLITLLKGTVNRNDFGISDFPDLVAPMVTLSITEHIAR